jgi:hypothetical protein
MTRQCAWCDCYLDLDQSEICVTHGICERCVERIRHSVMDSIGPPSDHIVLPTEGPQASSLTMR